MVGLGLLLCVCLLELQTRNDLIWSVCVYLSSILEPVPCNMSNKCDTQTQLFPSTTHKLFTQTHRVTVYPFGSIVHVTWYICSPFTEERTRFLILPCNIILILILQSCQLEFLFLSLFFHFSLFLSLSHITPNASNKNYSVQVQHC